jgi:hypothetical protein
MLCRRESQKVNIAFAYLESSIGNSLNYGRYKQYDPQLILT